MTRPVKSNSASTSSLDSRGAAERDDVEGEPVLEVVDGVLVERADRPSR